MRSLRCVVLLAPGGLVTPVRWIPAATGVLILGINKATKLLTYLVGQDKTYDVERFA